MIEHDNRIAAIKIAVAQYCTNKRMPVYVSRLAQEFALGMHSNGHSAFRCIAGGKTEVDKLFDELSLTKMRVLNTMKSVGEPVSIIEICWLCGANSDESELVAEYVQNLVTERKIKRLKVGDRVVYQINEVEHE